MSITQGINVFIVITRLRTDHLQQAWKMTGTRFLPSCLTLLVLCIWSSLFSIGNLHNHPHSMSGKQVSPTLFSHIFLNSFSRSTLVSLIDVTFIEKINYQYLCKTVLFSMCTELLALLKIIQTSSFMGRLDLPISINWKGICAQRPQFKILNMPQSKLDVLLCNWDIIAIYILVPLQLILYIDFS